MPSAPPSVVYVDPLKLESELPVRGRADKEEWAYFVENIRHWGVLNPIVLSRTGAVVHGRRRVAAAIEAGQLKVPTICFKRLGSAVNEPLASLRADLAENIQRRPLRPVELAEAFFDLHVREGLAIGELALDTGLSSKYVGNLIRIKKSAHPDLWQIFANFGEAVDWAVMAEVATLPPSVQVATWNARVSAAAGGKPGRRKKPGEKELRRLLTEVSGRKGGYWQGYRDALARVLGTSVKALKEAGQASAGAAGNEASVPVDTFG